MQKFFWPEISVKGKFKKQNDFFLLIVIFIVREHLCPKLRPYKTDFTKGNYKTILYKRGGEGAERGGSCRLKPPMGVKWIGVSEGSKSQGGIVERARCL